MKTFRFVSTMCLLAVSMWLHADLLSDLLDGDYNAHTMTTEQQDSVLGNVPQGRFRLEYDNKQTLFRHSFLADYYIVDNQKHTRTHLSDTLVRDALLSPDGRYIAFVKGNNLYLHKLDFGTEVAITTDDNSQIFNGLTDWLYEEEFGVTALFAFSPDSKQLAFVRFDETEVPTFEWQEFLGGTYPAKDSLRYPKAGEPNAKVSVCVYDIKTKTIRTMQTHDADEDVYLPRLRWTNPQQHGKEMQPADLAVLKLNRDQTKMEVLLCNPRSTVTRLLYKEESRDYFIDYELFDQWRWLSDNRMIILSEKSGWRATYLYSAQGIQQQQLTKDGVDITALYGFNEATQTLFYQQATSPITRQGMAMNIKRGTVVPLTDNDGTHDLTFSHDFRQMIDCYQSLNTPNRYSLYSLAKDAAPKLQSVLLDNSDLTRQWAALNLPEKEFFSFATEHGDRLNGYILKPKHLQANRRYPVVQLQYSGPQSQRVLNRWRKRWEYYLADQGYVVVCVDGRGTDCRGRAFRNASYMQLGLVEAQDQIAAARYVQTLPFVDDQRLCICGWSYGGFQTIMTMSQPDSPFRCGIAIAPVTDWRFYDTAYAERYMRRPQVNEAGYQAADLVARAEQLNGQLLIVHGLADDNVHAQNTLLYVDALVQAGKQFDMQIYPDDNHFLKKRGNYLHLHQTLMRFLRNNL